MKRGLAIIFFSIFCVFPVFAQLQKSDLTTEFIKLENFKISFKLISNFRELQSIDVRLIKEREVFANLFNHLQSKRGSIEIDERSNTIIITDLPERVAVLKQFVLALDKSEFTIKNLVQQNSSEDEWETVFVKLKNINFYKCNSFLDYDEYGVTYKEFIKRVSHYLTQKGAIEIDGRSKTVIITDIKSNIDFIKFVTDTFDYQFLPFNEDRECVKGETLKHRKFIH